MKAFILYAPVIFTAIIFLINYKKSENNGQKAHLAAYILPGIIVFSISIFFFALAGITCKSISSLLFSPKYDAKVVEYEAMESDDGEVSVAVVAFKNKQNQLIKKPLNYGSSHPVELGKIIKISYEEGDKSVINLSFGTQKLIVFLVVFFLFILGLAMTWIILYSLGKDYSVVFRIGAVFFMYLVFPGAMLFFIWMMSSVVLEYFQGKRDETPIWVLGICIFFIIVLIPAFLGYMKRLLGKINKTSGKTIKFKKTNF